MIIYRILPSILQAKKRIWTKINFCLWINAGTIFASSRFVPAGATKPKNPLFSIS
jgi:hypothetical protein